MMQRRGFLGLLGAVVAAPLAPSPVRVPVSPPATTITVTVDVAALNQSIRELRAEVEAVQRCACTPTS